MAKSGRDSIHAEDFSKEPSSADSTIRTLAAADAEHRVEIDGLHEATDRLRRVLTWGIGIIVSSVIGCAGIFITLFMFWASGHNERLDRMEATAVVLGDDVSILKTDTAVIKSQNAQNVTIQAELRAIQTKMSRLEALIEHRQP